MLRTIALTSLASLGLLSAAAAPAGAVEPAHYHVQYRLPFWQERVFDSHRAAHRFEDLKRAEGFDAYVIHHGDHFHVRFRLFDWQTYRTVHSHAFAHELEDMLRARGYQARVIHH